jgi:hypothetical protein
VKLAEGSSALVGSLTSNMFGGWLRHSFCFCQYQPHDLGGGVYDLMWRMVPC